MLVPTAPPSNVTGRNKSSTSIFVQWDQVPAADQNGDILSYTVTYTRLPSGPEKTKKVFPPATQTTLTGLNEYTNYSITVFASTSKGGGNQSAPIVVITDEGSELIYVFSFIVDCGQSLFGQSRLSWAGLERANSREGGKRECEASESRGEAGEKAGKEGGTAFSFVTDAFKFLCSPCIGELD